MSEGKADQPPKVGETATNITVEVSDPNRQLGDDVRKFAEEVSDSFTWDLHRHMDAIKTEEAKVPPAVRRKLTEKGFDRPVFRILDNERASEFLREAYQFGSVEPHNVLLVFNFPKPISYYWWKGYLPEKGNRDVRTHEKVIEWGKMYDESVWVVRDAVEEASGRPTPLYMRRINPDKNHEPMQFYYIWEISAQPFPMIDTSYDETEIIGIRTLEQIASFRLPDKAEAEI